MNFKSLLKKEENATKKFENKIITLLSPLNGKVISMDKVNDPTFSENILGFGCAIVPETSLLVSPADGIVQSLPETRHAVMIKGDSGAEILMHIGIDTVELRGKHYRSFVSVGDRVKMGDPLIEFDRENIKKEGYDITTPIIITNVDDFSSIKTIAENVQIKDPLMELEQR